MNIYSIQKTPYELLKDLAYKHRLLRKSAKMSQKELADRSGVSLGTLKRFENSGKISLESFLKLLLILERLKEMEDIMIQEEKLDDIESLFSDNTRIS